MPSRPIQQADIDSAQLQLELLTEAGEPVPSYIRYLAGLTLSDADALSSIFVGKFYLVYPTGEPVGLDAASAGYPYKASHWGAVHFWATKAEADRYDRGKEFSLRQVTAVQTVELRPVGNTKPYLHFSN